MCLCDAYQLPCFADFPVPWLGFSIRVRLWLCLWLYDPLTGTLCDWDTLGHIGTGTNRDGCRPSVSQSPLYPSPTGMGHNGNGTYDKDVPTWPNNPFIIVNVLNGLWVNMSNCQIADTPVSL